MGREVPDRFSTLISEVERGHAGATEELLELTYDELRRLARGKMARERPGQTLQPTALVHEAYLRLVRDPAASWETRGHFFAAAAEAMRRILVERARRAARQRHGGALRRVTLDDAASVDPPLPVDILALDSALSRLESLEPLMDRVVRLRFFAGLTLDEAARALGSSQRSVSRAWTGARAWLQRELTRAGDT